MSEDKHVPKIYSPDITPYSFEGESYFFGTMLSILVAPIRLITRVMHNIFVLPADLQKGYANSLLVTSGILMCLGILDALLERKWPLMISQIPALLFAIKLRNQAIRSTKVAEAKRVIDIDVEPINDTCNAICDELNNIIRSDS